jgi:aspartate ammonia-lyase
MDVELMGEQTALSLKTHAYSGKALKDYPTFLTYLLQVKRACAFANSQLGCLSQVDYEKIDLACQELIQQNDLFCADVLQGGGGIAVHMNINEALCHHLGDPSWIMKVNASQSTTDVCATALSLALAESINDCKEVCFSLVKALKQLANDHMRRDTTGRTCLRDAGLIKHGERFSGFTQLFTRQYEALETQADFAYSNLGATALGTGEGIDPALRSSYRDLALEKLSQLTGINIKLHPHFIDSVQNRDDLYALASVIENMAASLLKMAKDIRLLASGPQYGFNEIQLPLIIKGSSFYQHKINPTLEETVIQMSFMVLGLVKSAKLGVEHAELDMSIYYMHSAICLLDALRLINNLLPKYIQYNLTKLKIN